MFTLSKDYGIININNTIGIFMNIATRLEQVRNNLKMSKKEFSEALKITPASYFNYIGLKRQIPTDLVIILNQKYNVSIDWLLIGTGNMYLDALSTYINQFDDSKQRLLTLVLGRALLNDEIEVLSEHLEEYYLLSGIKDSFKSIGEGYGFWKKLISGKRDKNSFILIFAKVLKSFNNNFKKEDLKEENAKKYLIELISEYNLRLIKDRAKHFLTDGEKKNLIQWVDEELSNFDAFVIFKYTDEVLEFLRTEINSFNKKSF